MLIRTRSAQSILEYAVVTGVVVLAIIFGGPVLVRSINARFKIMDNNTQDAFQERITQVPATPSASGCLCSPSSDTPSDWPASNCNVNSCNEQQRYHYRQCSPLKCKQEYDCISDPTCCSEAIPTTCGIMLENPVYADPALNKCDTRAPLHTAFNGLPASAKGPCVRPNGDETQDCSVGEKIYRTRCGIAGGGTRDFFACVPDSDCNPSCNSVLLTGGGNSAQCDAGSEIRSSLRGEVDIRLASPALDSPVRRWHEASTAENPKGERAYWLDMTFVNDLAACTPPPGAPAPRSCQRYCLNCTRPNPDATACVQWTCLLPVIGNITRDIQHDSKQHRGDGSRGRFKVTAYADDMNIVMTCFNPDWTISQQSGNRLLSVCNEGDPQHILEVLGDEDPPTHHFCYGAKTDGAQYNGYGQVECIGTTAYLEIWAGPAPTVSGPDNRPTYGYQFCFEFVQE